MTPVDLYMRRITRQWPGWEQHPEAVRAIADGARALLAAERRRIRKAIRARDVELLEWLRGSPHGSVDRAMAAACRAELHVAAACVRAPRAGRGGGGR